MLFKLAKFSTWKVVNVRFTFVRATLIWPPCAYAYDAVFNYIITNYFSIWPLLHSVHQATSEMVFPTFCYKVKDLKCYFNIESFVHNIRFIMKIFPLHFQLIPLKSEINCRFPTRPLNSNITVWYSGIENVMEQSFLLFAKCMFSRFQ